MRAAFERLESVARELVYNSPSVLPTANADLLMNMLVLPADEPGAELSLSLSDTHRGIAATRAFDAAHFARLRRPRR